MLVERLQGVATIDEQLPGLHQDLWKWLEGLGPAFLKYVSSTWPNFVADA